MVTCEKPHLYIFGSVTPGAAYRPSLSVRRSLRQYSVRPFACAACCPRGRLSGAPTFTRFRFLEPDSSHLPLGDPDVFAPNPFGLQRQFPLCSGAYALTLNSPHIPFHMPLALLGASSSCPPVLFPAPAHSRSPASCSPSTLVRAENVLLLSCSPSDCSRFPPSHFPMAATAPRTLVPVDIATSCRTLRALLSFFFSCIPCAPYPGTVFLSCSAPGGSLLLHLVLSCRLRPSCCFFITRHIPPYSLQLKLLPTSSPLFELTLRAFPRPPYVPDTVGILCYRQHSSFFTHAALSTRERVIASVPGTTISCRLPSSLPSFDIP